MRSRTASVIRHGLIATAFSLFLAPHVLAGGMVVTSSRPPRAATPPVSQRAPSATVSHFAPAPVVISIATTPSPQTAPEPVFVDLRGPDGQLRRFSVVGGRDAIEAPQIVLHPGQSLNIQWVSAK